MTERYRHYLETFLVDLGSESGSIEFRCGFTLLSDHLLSRFKLMVPAVDGDADGERNLIIAIIFEQIEDVIDKPIAENRKTTH